METTPVQEVNINNADTLTPRIETSSKKIVLFFIILIIIILIIAAGIVGYFISMNHTINKTLNHQPNQTYQPSQTNNLVTLIPTNFPTSSNSNQQQIKIMGIYELQDSVIFTTNQPSYSTMYFWFNPQLKNTQYGDGLNTAHTLSQLSKGEGYQFKLYTHSPNDGFLSDTYTFQGNKIVLADPRCPQSVEYDNKNQIISAVCSSNACVKDTTFITNDCPSTKIFQKKIQQINSSELATLTPTPPF